MATCAGVFDFKLKHQLEAETLKTDEENKTNPSWKLCSLIKINSFYAYIFKKIPKINNLLEPDSVKR